MPFRRGCGAQAQAIAGLSPSTDRLCRGAVGGDLGDRSLWRGPAHHTLQIAGGMPGRAEGGVFSVALLGCHFLGPGAPRSSL